MRNKKNASDNAAILRAELRDIDARRAAVLQQLHDPESQINPKVPLWNIVADYLQSKGGTDTLENIVQSLQAAGHNLGRYPKRTVKACVVSPSLRSVFPIRTEVRSGVKVEHVTLRPTSGRIVYAPVRTNQQTGSAALLN